jgi:hypothetical protein
MSQSDFYDAHALLPKYSENLDRCYDRKQRIFQRSSIKPPTHAIVRNTGRFQHFRILPPSILAVILSALRLIQVLCVEINYRSTIRSHAARNPRCKLIGIFQGASHLVSQGIRLPSHIACRHCWTDPRQGVAVCASPR